MCGRSSLRDWYFLLAGALLTHYNSELDAARAHGAALDAQNESALKAAGDACRAAMRSAHTRHADDCRERFRREVLANKPFWRFEQKLLAPHSHSAAEQQWLFAQVRAPFHIDITSSAFCDADGPESTEAQTRADEWRRATQQETDEWMEKSIRKARDVPCHPARTWGSWMINCLLDVTGGGAIRRGRDGAPATPGGRARGPFRIQGSDDGLAHAPLRKSW